MFSLFLGNSSSKYFDYTTAGNTRTTIMFLNSTTRKRPLVLILALLALAGSGCAAFRPTDPAGPRSDVRLYPVGLADPAARLEEASLAWYQLAQRYGLARKSDATLNPYTATIQNLPSNLPAPITLPKIGTEPQQTEEQTRESLRRFINDWQRLIGAEPDDLSLVERTDDASGIKVARYEQRPFRYPLRGEFGNLIIRFRDNGQVVDLSSNCLPNADRLQATLNTITPQVSGEEAANNVKSQPIPFGQQTVTLPANAVVEPAQLVVYALPSPGQTSGLELHLAWEINITNGPIKTVYFDAVSSQIIGAT